jgi:Raf kinase inhibitor-like YbhB/YbcL family protein
MGTIQKKMVYAEHNKTKQISRYCIIPIIAINIIVCLSFFMTSRNNTTQSAATTATDDEELFTLRSTAFQHGTSIPSKFAKRKSLDDSISPPLEWSGVPSGTKSFVLIVDDPDAPDPQHPKMTWVHWVLYNLPPTINSLPEGVESTTKTSTESLLLPEGTKQGLNDWKVTGYVGPSPPIGRHRYYFKLIALDIMLPDLTAAPTKAMVEKAITMHGRQILGRAVLMGTYQQSDNERGSS